MTERDPELREWLLFRAKQSLRVQERVQAIKKARAERLANMTPEQKEAYFESIEEAIKASKAIEDSLRGRASRLARGRGRF